MKVCFKCSQEKPITEFYYHRQMADGTLNKCKTCTKKDTAERLAKKMAEPEFRIKEAQRHREKARRYRNAGRTVEDANTKRECILKYREKHPQKFHAHNMVAAAIRSGVLIKQPCAKCGSGNTHGHHEDYSKPLDVIWLCPRHHAERHVEINDMKRLQSTL